MKKFMAFAAILLLMSRGFALRDPTQPLGTKKFERSERNAAVSFIVIGKNRRIANINGQLAKAGDEVDGLKVIAIESNTVQLKDAQGEFLVALHKSGVIKKQVK